MADVCLVKKFGIDLRRYFVSNHCVASMKNELIDMCLFSGEGKPTLLGAYAMTSAEALHLGDALINTVRSSDNLKKKDMLSLAHNHIVSAYQLLKDADAEKAEELKKMFDIRFIKQELKHDTGYIG